MRILALALACAWLSGCANAPAPLAFEVTDPVAFLRDFDMCKGYAAQGRQSFSVGSIATAGAKAGLGSAPAAAVNPIVPAIAALGGASGEALAELNLLGTTERRLVTRCMERKGDKSGAYFVLDPND
jgi:hypothetical protein